MEQLSVSPKSVPDLLISELLMHMAIVTLVNVWKCVYVTHGVSWLWGGCSLRKAAVGYLLCKFCSAGKAS